MESTHLVNVHLLAIILMEGIVYQEVFPRGIACQVALIPKFFFGFEISL